MTKEQWTKVLSIVLGAVLAVVAVMGWIVEPVEIVMPETGIEAKAVERGSLLCATESGNCVESWNGSDFYIYSDAGSTQKYHVDGATGDVDAEGAGNFAGTLTTGGLFYPYALTLTATTTTITPTATVYNLDSAAAVTITLAASGIEGQLLILCGDDANNITVADTNIRTNDGAAQVIGQYDCITWVYVDSEWLELSESNNS